MPSKLLAPGDPAYPALLADLPSAHREEGGDASPPPPPLYVRGELPRGPAIAIVGTRAASEAALAFTRGLVSELVRGGFCIWSGGAVGIDAAAHEAAMSEGGATVAVLGGGLGCPYPRDNIPLFERVLASGCALASRVADDVRPRRALFLQRNEILAAATSATIVIQAPLKSGARSTASAARRLGRPLFVVPHAPWDEGGLGCALELTLGARAVTSAADVISALSGGAGDSAAEALARASRPRASRPRARASRAPRAPRARSPAHGTPEASAQGSTGASTQLTLASSELAPRTNEACEPGLSSEHQVGQTIEGDLGSPHERAILRVLSDLPSHIDEVCEKAALSVRDAAGALLTLTLQAVVVEGPPGFYRRARR